MRFFTTFVASASVFASVVSAAQHNVTVGQGNGIVYEPKFLQGVVAGDTVSFKFVSKNHTVTQSTFTAPCVAKPEGVNSGFIPVDPAAATQPEWTIQIDNVTAPLWFYCAQGAHCKGGMVFAINPTADKTYDAFLAAAQGVTPSSTSTNTVTVTGSRTSGSQTSADAPSASQTGNSALGISTPKLTSALAALGLIAGLTL